MKAKAKSDRAIRAEMQQRIAAWLDLKLDAREAKRQAIRDRFDWRLPGEHVIPWTQQQLRKLMKDR